MTWTTVKDRIGSDVGRVEHGAIAGVSKWDCGGTGQSRYFEEGRTYGGGREQGEIPAILTPIVSI